jgi:hypothetical protein
VRDAAAGVAAAEAENGALLRRHTAACGECLRLLRDVHSTLLALVEGCLLGKQARLDEEHCRWLVNHVRTLHRSGGEGGERQRRTGEGGAGPGSSQSGALPLVRRGARRGPGGRSRGPLCGRTGRCGALWGRPASPL